MKIIIPGKPIAKARPKFFRRGKGVGTYNPQETEEGRFLTLAIGQVEGRIEGPVCLEAVFVFDRPKSHFGTGRNASKLKASAPKYHVKTPDVDNCLKFVKDCLNGVAWKDDCQVVKVYAEKFYGEHPKTELVISEF